MTITTGDPASPWGDPRPADVPPFATAPPSPPADAPPVAGQLPGAGHDLAIVFQGSGSEYFRIWAVNLLLTLVTIGLYYPWAKVRRLRYFYGNTFIGDHALDFHGDPKIMLRGFLIGAALAITYSVAGKISPMAGLVAFLVVATLWPALFWASQRFRLANTSWRGLRFRFSGSLGGAYRSMLPLFIPGAFMLAIIGLTAGVDAMREQQARALAVFAMMPLILLAAPLLLWLMKRYQHGHFAFGPIETRLRTGVGSFYMLALKTLGVSLLVALASMLVALLVGIVVAVAGRGMHLDRFSMGASRWGMAAIVVGVSLYYLVVLSVLIPYVTSRLQNMVWGRTQSDDIRFESRLRFWPYFWLTAKNLVLIVITLGLYVPFARIAVTRMRLEAVSVRSVLDPDQLMSSVHDLAQPGAAGDAAGDLLGFDIGW